MKKENEMNENENLNVNEGPAPADPAPQDAPSYYQPAPEPAPQKKGFPKVILIAVLAVVAVAALFFGVKAMFGGSPLKQTVSGIQKSVQALEKTQLASMAKSMESSGSVNVSIDASKLSDVIFGGRSDAELPLKLDITSYADGKGGKAAFEIDAQLKNKTIVHGTFTASEEQIALACEQLLGKTNYSLSFKDMAKNLKGSLLDPDSDSDYALPEEIFNWLTGLKNGPIAPMKDLVKDGKAVYEDALNVLLKSTEKNAEITKASETVSIGEKDVKTNAVTLKLNGKQAAAIMTDVLKWAKADKGLKNLLTKFADTYGPLMEMENMDPEDFIDEFYDSIDDGLDAMEDADKDDVNLTAVFYLNKSGGQLVKAEITTKDKYGKTTYTFEGGPDWKDPAYVSFSEKTPYGKSSVTYTVDENTKSQFSAKIKVKEDSDTTMSCSISWDKSTGDLRVTSNEMDLKLTGTMTQKGKVTTIVLKKLEYDGMTVKDLGTTVTINESAKLPSISKTTEVLKLSEDDIEALVEDVEEAVQELVESVQDAVN